MEKLLEKLSEQFGYAAPFMYAAAAYSFFHWLDENASAEAKAALARTMRFKDYKNEQVASALVEVFDQIYTYPLFRWRAFFRSLLFTTVVSAIYVFEVGHKLNICGNPRCRPSAVCTSPLWDVNVLPTALLFNVFTDYLSLFVIRPLLIRSGTKPVIGLTLGAMSGAAIVLGANFLREFVLFELADLVSFELFMRVSGLLIYEGPSVLLIACSCGFHLVALVRARHPDGPLINAFVVGGRKNAVVPERGEGASAKGDWMRSSCCCLSLHNCRASGLQRLSRWARLERRNRQGAQTCALGIRTTHLRRIILVRWLSTTAEGHSHRSDRRPTTSGLLRLADILKVRRVMMAFHGGLQAEVTTANDRLEASRRLEFYFVTASGDGRRTKQG